MGYSQLEDENFDCKEKIDSPFGKTVCAYANTSGGKIIVRIPKNDRVLVCNDESLLEAWYEFEVMNE